MKTVRCPTTSHGMLPRQGDVESHAVQCKRASMQNDPPANARVPLLSTMCCNGTRVCSRFRTSFLTHNFRGWAE
eukprot:3880042-Rhodomonas_salina.2